MNRDLQARAKQYALRVIKLYGALPRRREAYVLGDQLLACATSAGAHYREARRAKSDRDFISKIEGGLGELDESHYWLELIGESGMIEMKLLEPLLAEANELMAIFVTVAKNVKKRPKDGK